MSLPPFTYSLAAVSLLLCAPIANMTRAHCDTRASNYHQASWRPVVVHAVSELSAYPAAIMNRAYEVIVDQPAHGTHVVRGFNGSASQKTLIASRAGGTP